MDTALIHPAEPPRLSLAQLPTPIHECRNLPAAAGIRQLLVKRDDLTGFEASGNKIRKLEYTIADAKEQGADTLVTDGGWQSNSCRASAAAGARCGMHVRLVLRSKDPSPTVEANLFLDHLLGAEISFETPERFSNERRLIADEAMQEQRNKGRSPYFFPVGASTPLGCWGYIRCVAELREQLGHDTKVDLYCPTCSMGTHAGLILGVAMFGLSNWRVRAVPVSDSIDFFMTETRALVNDAIEQYHLGLTEADTPIDLIDGFIGEGYAIPTEASMEALHLAARTEAMLMDPTYSSKAFAGVLATLRANGGRGDALPVFIHTGGGFGLLARRELFDFCQ